MVGATCTRDGRRRRHGNVLGRGITVSEDLFDLGYRLGLEEGFVLKSVEDLRVSVRGTGSVKGGM